MSCLRYESKFTSFQKYVEEHRKDCPKEKAKDAGKDF